MDVLNLNDFTTKKINEILDRAQAFRDGKKVDFDGSKIALAIKKGFDSVALDEEEAKYSEKDINKVYNLVIEEIGNLGVERIKIEEIQDLIEKYLQQEGYEFVTVEDLILE